MNMIQKTIESLKEKTKISPDKNWSLSKAESWKSKNSDEEMEELLKSIVSNDDETKRSIRRFSHK